MQRSDMRAWARPRAGAALVLVLLLALGAALAARDRLAVAAPPGQALLVSLAGPAGTEIAILDLTTGAELNRVPHPDRAYREISLSPDGRRAAVVRSEPDTLAGQVLEIRSLPDWTLEAVLPLGLQAPPLADLATREPELLANPWLASAAFSADGKLAALAFYGGSGPIPQLIVTAYDLEKRAWASWAKGLGGTSYVWLFPSRERLLVVNRSVLPQWTNSLGDVFALDPQTGRVLAQQAIPRLITAYLPVRGQSAPSMAPGLAAPVLVGNQLWLVTDDLARLILDPRTLEIRSADPPLTRDLAAQFVALAGDWLVAFSTEASALLVIDAASWQLTATHRLPEEGFPYRWHLVGSDPAQHAVYLADIAESCLWRFQLADGTLPPLACQLYLQSPWIDFYSWPATLPRNTAPAAASGLLAPSLSWLAGTATALLAGTFLVAALGKIVSLGRLAHLVATVLPRLRRWARPAALGTVALELLTGVLLLLPGTQRAGLVLAATALLAFTAFAVVGARRAPGADCSCFGNLVPSKLGRATVLRNLVLLALVAVGWPATAAPSPPELAIAAGLLLAVLAVSRLVAAAASLRRLSPGTEPRHAA
ncbi:MAG: hypothetical protein J7453_10665 [Thermomicrobium sp.]|nr:hypothetical protein [Thermomicrobium sp.]